MRGIHHLHLRKRLSRALEPYPARTFWKRLLDKTVYVVGPQFVSKLVELKGREKGQEAYNQKVRELVRDFYSLTAAELGAFTESYFGTVKASVIENPTIDQIKVYINAGIPVVVPAAGQELGNPFYTGVGPLYHFIVLRGYDGENFITNDPGTRRGENYTFAQSVVMSAMGDWNDGDPANGAKRILIFEKK